jgi:TetR/AcrR family transcriptional regulator
MGRSRREQRPRDAGATRRTLLEAATSVFAEHGFAGARVDEIAGRARVNKRMIYAYYGDKEGLYREVLAAHLAAPEQTPDASEDPRRALEELVRWYFRLLAGDPAFARLLAWDMLSGGPRRRAMLADSVAPTLERVTELVRRGVASGSLRADLDPEMLRTSVVALCVGYFLQHPVMEAARARTGRRFTDEEFLAHACRLLFGENGAAVGAGGRRGGTRGG